MAVLLVVWMRRRFCWDHHCPAALTGNSKLGMFVKNKGSWTLNFLHRYPKLRTEKPGLGSACRRLLLLDSLFGACTWLVLLSSFPVLPAHGLQNTVWRHHPFFASALVTETDKHGYPDATKPLSLQAQSQSGAGFVASLARLPEPRLFRFPAPSSWAFRFQHCLFAKG